MQDNENVTPHFTYGEATFSATAQARGIPNIPNEQELNNIKFTCEQMEIVRNIYSKAAGKPVGINMSSLFRAEAVNKAVGGSETSDHRKGLACDHTTRIFTPRECAKLLIAAAQRGEIKFDQIILEFPDAKNPDGAWLHIGFGSKMRGQVLTAKKNSLGKTLYIGGLEK